MTALEDLTEGIRALATDLAHPASDDLPTMGDIVTKLCELVGDDLPRKPYDEQLAEASFERQRSAAAPPWSEQSGTVRAHWLYTTRVVREQMEADGYRRVADPSEDAPMPRRWTFAINIPEGVKVRLDGMPHGTFVRDGNCLRKEPPLATGPSTVPLNRMDEIADFGFVEVLP